MNPLLFLKGFAWLSIIALCCSIFSDFWLPMLIGAIAFTLIYKALH
jgi:ABC-type transport system involved in multi-copper enzyme maturation permease subunit